MGVGCGQPAVGQPGLPLVVIVTRTDGETDGTRTRGQAAHQSRPKTEHAIEGLGRRRWATNQIRRRLPHACTPSSNSVRLSKKIIIKNIIR